jgi:adenosylcobinamide-phosphate synthase
MTVIIAFILDYYLREPPAALHPVVWMGKALSFAGERIVTFSAACAFISGMLIWLIYAGVFFALYATADHYCASLPPALAVPVTALILKPMFSLRMLIDEVEKVEKHLEVSLEEGRYRLSHIVSRDTADLDHDMVRESALESLSENISDSLVAPLLWFLVLGLPGAALYRFANTADAMWGYRDRREWMGKWAACVDDIMNFIPARITALLLWIVFGCAFPLRLLRSEAEKTASPNSGYPMSALALGLDVRLRKPGVYTLNPAGRSPMESDMACGISKVRTTALISVLIIGCLNFGAQYV